MKRSESSQADEYVHHYRIGLQQLSPTEAVREVQQPHIQKYSHVT